MPQKSRNEATGTSESKFDPRLPNSAEALPRILNQLRKLVADGAVELALENKVLPCKPAN